MPVTAPVSMTPFAIPVCTGPHHIPVCTAAHIPVCSSQTTWSFPACGVPLPTCNMQHIPACSLPQIPFPHHTFPPLFAHPHNPASHIPRQQHMSPPTTQFTANHNQPHHHHHHHHQHQQPQHHQPFHQVSLDIKLLNIILCNNMESCMFRKRTQMTEIVHFLAYCNKVDRLVVWFCL